MRIALKMEDMFMRKVAFFGFAFLVGCGGITPVSGDYDITITYSAATCPLAEGVSVGDTEDVVGNIQFNDDGTVTLDGDTDTLCTAEGTEVTCSAEFAETSPDADYTINQTWTIDLSWDSSTSFTGTQVQDIDCEGGDCELLMEYLELSFPCDMTLDLVGTLVEDDAAE